MSKWRRLRRGLIIAVAGALVLCLALLVYGRVRLRRAEATFLKTYGTLDLASFERPDPPRIENAAEWLQAGAQAIFLEQQDRGLLLQTASRTQMDWSDAERQALDRFLDENRCALALLHRAASAPQASYRIRSSQGVAAPIPDFMALRLAANLLTVEARLAIGRGDRPTAVAALKALARLSASLENETPLISLLVGVASEHGLLQALADVAAQPSGRPDQAALLAAAREALPSNDLKPRLRKTFAAEGLAVSQAFSGRMGSYREWRPSDMRLLASVLAPFSDLLRAETLDQFAAQASALDRPDGRGAVQTEERRAQASHLWHVRIASMSVPSVSRALDSLDRVAAKRLLVEAALTLRSSNAAGGYPAALPPELQRSDPVSGQPLVYTLHPDGSAVLALQTPARAGSSPELKTISLPALPRRAPQR